MNRDHEKIVRFDIWCKKCKFKDKSEEDDPCFDCLAETVNFESTKPVKFEEKKREN